MEHFYRFLTRAVCCATIKAISYRIHGGSFYMNKLHIVLYQPEIHANTGNISRTCAITGADLHLIRPLGFSTDDRHLRRAGLDYWDKLNITYYDNVEAFYEQHPDAHVFYFTTKGRHRHSDITFQDGDFLVFGKETKGLPEELLLKNEQTCLRVLDLKELHQ